MLKDKIHWMLNEVFLKVHYYLLTKRFITTFKYNFVEIYNNLAMIDDIWFGILKQLRYELVCSTQYMTKIYSKSLSGFQMFE